MLTYRQILVLSAVALALWLAATACIRLWPQALQDPRMSAFSFASSIPVCWLCVIGARRWAGLKPQQLVTGTALVCAFAMLIDAFALRWAHGVYADSEQLCRLGAAWLLWGYGVSVVIALLISRTAGSVGVD